MSSHMMPRKRSLVAFRAPLLVRILRLTPVELENTPSMYGAGMNWALPRTVKILMDKKRDIMTDARTKTEYLPRVVEIETSNRHITSKDIAAYWLYSAFWAIITAPHRLVLTIFR